MKRRQFLQSLGAVAVGTLGARELLLPPEPAGVAPIESNWAKVLGPKCVEAQLAAYAPFRPGRTVELAADPLQERDLEEYRKATRRMAREAARRLDELTLEAITSGRVRS